MAKKKQLLIVPCGIETRFRLRLRRTFRFLLIVPCGIETEVAARVRTAHQSLLIVPCGIETCQTCIYSPIPLSFNRTLWN